MAIPNKQIGWSNFSNLLWEVSRELERVIVAKGCCACTTTTTTTTIACQYYRVTKNSTVIIMDSVTWTDCAGNPQSAFIQYPADIYPEFIEFCALAGSVANTGGEIEATIVVLSPTCPL
jgi:hypothetical protein